MLIIRAALWSLSLDERVQVQTFAKLGPVSLACKNSDATILLSFYLQLHRPPFFYQGGAFQHTNTAPYHHHHLPPCHQPFVRLKLALRQCGLAFHALAVLNSALLFLITSSVPSATHTQPPPHNRTKHAALNTLDCRKSDGNFYIDPFPEQPFSPQTISTRDSATADALMEQKVCLSISVCTRHWHIEE